MVSVVAMRPSSRSLHAAVVDRQVGGGEHLPQDLAGRRVRLGLAGTFCRAVSTASRLATSPWPCPPTPSARTTTAPRVALLFGVVRLPEADAVFVVGSHRALRGEFGVGQLHDELRDRSCSADSRVERDRRHCSSVGDGRGHRLSRRARSLQGMPDFVHRCTSCTMHA